MRQEELDPLTKVAMGVVRIDSSDTWRGRLQRIANVLQEELQPGAVWIYMLHLSNGQYRLEASAGPAASKAWPEISYSVTSSMPLGGTLRTALDSNEPVSSTSGVAIGIHRGQTCLFVVGLLRPADIAWHKLQELLEPLFSIYSERRMQKGVEGLRAELDYHLPWAQFRSQLGVMLQSSSGIRYIAYRELRQDRLDCLAAWGFESQVSLRELSWPVERFGSFQSAAAGRAVSIRDIDHSADFKLHTVSSLKDIRAFAAVPVSVGTDLVGVLSFGVPVVYDYSRLELSLLETQANIAGVAITHYRRPASTYPSTASLKEASVRTALEVMASAARHDGFLHLSNAQELLTQLGKSISDSKQVAILDKIESVNLNLGLVFERISQASKIPSYKWSTESIKSVWQQAVNQFAGRLDSLSIRVLGPSNDIRVDMYPEWIRTVFVQLLLNSADAYGSRGFSLGAPAKRNREIRLTIIEPKTEGEVVRVRYSDNAGGIALRRLSSGKIGEEVPLSELIFRAGVSSKKRENSGWGLALARTVMAEHEGGIALIDNTSTGVTFELSLPGVVR